MKLKGKVVIYKDKEHVTATTYGAHAFKDPNLTWQEKGLHGYLSTMPENITLEKILKRTKNGRNLTLKIMNKLIEKGYGARVRLYNKHHRIFQWLYICFPTPTKITEKNILLILNSVCPKQPQFKLWFVGISACNITNVIYIYNTLLKNNKVYNDTLEKQSVYCKDKSVGSRRRNLDEEPSNIFATREPIEKTIGKKKYVSKADKLIAHWNTLGLRKHLDPKTKVYKSSKARINKLLKGTYFKHTSEKSQNRKFTYIEIRKAMERFALSVISDIHAPLDKKTIKGFSLCDFIFYPYAANNKSKFLQYLKEEPKEIEIYRSLRQDDYPKTTQRLIDKLNNNGENVNEKDLPIMNQLIRTSALIQEFWQDNEDKFMIDWPIPTIIDKLITVSNGRGIMGLTTPMIYKTILPQELIKDKYMRRR